MLDVSQSLIAFDDEKRRQYAELFGVAPEEVIIVGVDEAGRGPLAGPVAAGAVAVRCGTGIVGVNDSKKLSEKRRNKLREEIRENTLANSVDLVPAKIIDSVNILEATLFAMRNAVYCCIETAFPDVRESAKPLPIVILVDGNKKFENNDLIQETVVGGDAKSFAIACASIMAKTVRDEYMINHIAAEYPDYAFDKHKGYGTREHIAAINKYGLCSEHRRTFVKKILAKQQAAQAAKLAEVAKQEVEDYPF
ncbi:MAG: ribonuclease HII [Oscillospiraceae bacterium]|jgi:ribonuclease HII|nr:ribonuclease HII [Oscillospiraceae bacterium]